MTPRTDHRHRPRRRRSGFTLTELMIAIAVLIGVLLATSKIFSTTSKVTSAGKATADILQEVSAIERQIRKDFGRLSRDGVLAIRNVAVDNDVNGAALLNPNLPPDAKLRCDQIVFFADGLESAHTFRVGWGTNHKGQGAVSRVYYGHVFQLGEVGREVDLRGADVYARDTEPGEPMYPWTSGTIDMQFTRFTFNNPDGTEMFEPGASFTAAPPPPDARRWGFGRQAVLLVDDDTAAIDSNQKTFYLDQVLTARSIFRVDPRLGDTPQILHGRVDAAATDLNELRQLVQYTPFPGYIPRPWSLPDRNPQDQFSLISEELLYYPRAERYAPSMHRVDQALTNHFLGSACSSVRIEWTYAPGTGEVVDPLGNVVPGLEGFQLNPESAQPWFGLQDPDLGIEPYDTEDDWFGAKTVFFENVERYPILGWGAGVDVYEAVFGYNQSRPLNAAGLTDQTLGYTPWPSAIRVTLTIHDPATTLEGGREVQFVINLPDRGGLASR